jgi:hypothetical protein
MGRRSRNRAQNTRSRPLENEAELKASYEAILKEQTVNDRQIATRFYEIFEKSGVPKTWKTLIRYPFIDGANYMEHDFMNPPKVTRWFPGHEISKRGDHLFWACLGVEVDVRLALYLHHSVEVHRNGRQG